LSLKRELDMGKKVSSVLELPLGENEYR
jgi:hypothetical protein